LRFDTEIPMTGNVQADTQRVHTALENVIRAHPEQWLWIHRRWKTRPPGEPGLY
jgi:KDO2-lipid IV(A) lauroyltransferase